MSFHAARGTVPPFNSGGIRCAVAQLLQDTLNAKPGAMSVADIDVQDTLSLSMLDDLHMRQCPGDTVS